VAYFIQVSDCDAFESPDVNPENERWLWGVDDKTVKVMSVVFGQRDEMIRLMKSIRFVRPSTDGPGSIVAFPAKLAIRATRHALKTNVYGYGDERNIEKPFRLSDCADIDASASGEAPEPVVLETTLDSDDVWEIENPTDIEVSRYIPCMTPEVISRFEELAQDDMWILGIRYAVEVDVDEES
jgi:hypothetical protein